METLHIEILNPKAKSILRDLESLNIISIKNNLDSKKKLIEISSKMKSKKSEVISLDEIVKEVKSVRKNRYAKNKA